MGNIRLWQVKVCFVIALQFLASSVAQVTDCSPRCWNPIQRSTGYWNSTKQEGAANEEECKELCVNNGTCIGVDLVMTNYGLQCWFQLTELVAYTAAYLNHWSLANCTGECASYCWKTVQVGVKGTYQPNITDENHCKLLCSRTPTCTGIDYSDYAPRCFLIFAANPLTNQSIVRHWDIQRNVSTSCYTSPTVSIISSTVESLRSSTESLVVKQSSTLYLEGKTTGTTNKPTTCNYTVQSSTTYLEGKTTGTPSKLTTCTSIIIALATLLGLCIVIIIGLIINTIRILRQSCQKSDTKSDELEINHGDLQRAETEGGTYEDIVQENTEEYYIPKLDMTMDWVTLESVATEQGTLTDESKPAFNTNQNLFTNV